MYEDLTAMSDPRHLHKVTEWLTHLKLKVEVNFLETRFVFLDKKRNFFTVMNFFTRHPYHDDTTTTRSSPERRTRRRGNIHDHRRRKNIRSTHNEKTITDRKHDGTRNLNGAKFQNPETELFAVMLYGNKKKRGDHGANYNGGLIQGRYYYYYSG